MYDSPVREMVQSLMKSADLPLELVENKVAICDYIVRLLSNHCASIAMDFNYDAIPRYTINLVIPVLYNAEPEPEMPEKCLESSKEPSIIPLEGSLNRFSGVKTDERDDI